MTEGTKPRGYLDKYGSKLIDAGYRIIPILRGEKMPPLPEWTQIDADDDILAEWLADEHKGRPFKGLSRSSCGIQTRDNPFVDIDVRDPEIAQHMEEFVQERFGFGPVRVGQAPKRGMLFRTDEPFAKLASSAYNDAEGRKCQVEILCNGQQFVAFAKHEKTGKPYEWLYGDGPHKTVSADLPALNADQAREIIDEFERIAEEREWDRIRSARQNELIRSGKIDRDDSFADFAEKTIIDDDDLYKRLMAIPSAEDYDTWFQVGMALYHQYDGEPQGLEWWHEWSSQANNYDSDELDAKWATFAIEGKGRSPLTARYILKLAAEHLEEEVREALDEAKADLMLANDITNLRKVCDRIKRLEFDPLIRNQFAGLVKARYKAITNADLSITQARDLVRFEKPQVQRKSLPKWAEGFVFCQMDEVFYSLTRRVALSAQAFRQTYGRFLLTDQEKAEGKSAPEQDPVAVVLNLYEIPVVFSRLYMPGEDDLFRMNGTDYVNSYDGRNVPTVPEKYSNRARRNVDVIVNHFTHLFANERDREILIDALAWIVQNPGQRLNWAIVMQGTEGDGKTFVYRLMCAVLGLENAVTIGPQAVEEKYTAWAEGNQVVYVDEIKLHGHNRHDVLNRLKPLVTNTMVPVRRMNVDTYNVINTSNYIMSTNYRDALPITDQDSRYFILFSRFQTKRALRDFLAEHPNYYDDLHEALNESAGAVRKWLLERTIPTDFRPQGRAPDSEAKSIMVDFSKSDEQRTLEEILAKSPRLDMTTQLLNATALGEEFDKYDIILPFGKGLNRLLIDNGFTRLGRIWHGKGPALFWSQTPDRFSSGGKVSPAKVKAWLEDDL